MLGTYKVCAVEAAWDDFLEEAASKLGHGDERISSIKRRRHFAGRGTWRYKGLEVRHGIASSRKYGWVRNMGAVAKRRLGRGGQPLMGIAP